MAEDNNNEDAIELACRGLEAAVKKYCRKRTRTRNRDFAPALHVVHHASHLLHQLTLKRKSLKNAVTALETCWKDLLPQLKDKTTTTTTTALLLTHVFHQFLRIRDGMNLMTSGECRHPGDIKEAKKTNFPSHFHKLSHQKDGYTTLYSSDHYSGYGWDEFYNPHVGIQKRLLQALDSKDKDCWDTLLEYGAQAFETSLDQHNEVDIPKITNRLDQLRLLMTKDLERIASNVTFFTRDKMERLELVKGGQHITLERRANDFQVQDPNGCLPNNWNVADWNRAFAHLPPNKMHAMPPKNKIRRLVIEDSDDEGEPPVAVQTVQGRLAEGADPVSTGLRVRVTTKKTETTCDSLFEIKKKAGVSAQELQESREWLEAEEAGQQQKQEFDEIGELKQEIKEATAKVDFLQRVLARMKGRQDDDDELWDARESLREASMTLGSLLLSLCALEEAERNKNLADAQHWFRKALELVEKQEVVHEMLSKQTNDFTKKSRAIRRKLLLLRGRAHVNLGITLVELSFIEPDEGLEKEATTELQSALHCSEAIRARVVADDKPSETSVDRAEAGQLESLAHRWLGNSLWRHGRRKEAVLSYKQSSRFFIDSRHSAALSPDILVEAEIALGVECFYACTSLAEFALDALEKLQIVVQGHSRRQESLCKGEELFAIALDAYEMASLISANLQTLANHGSSPVSVEVVFRENAILAPREIEIHVKEISDWWDQKKQGIVLRPKDGTIHADSTTLRNDLFASGPLRPQHGNPKRYTVQEGSSRRKRRKLGRGFTSNATRIHGNVDEVTESRPSKKRKYRKWGDELLPQVTTECGEIIPFGYPACAPPLPLGAIPFSFNRLK